VLVAGAGAANAQTVITREITTEPVETIVERGPTGTVITRRPLDMTVPRAPVTLPAPTTLNEPVDTIEERETVGSSTTIETAPAPTIRQRTIVQRPRVAAAPRPQAKKTTQTVRKPIARNSVNTRVTTRTAPATRTVAVPVVVRAPMDLTEAQRGAIYRTIIEERPVPRTVVTDEGLLPPVSVPRVGAPVVREQVISERIIAPAAPAPVVRETFGAAPMVTSVAAPARVELAVGSRIPGTVPLYALPPTIGMQIPAVRQYRYAQVNDRVFLVDPASGLIVAELDE
jgi:hypothetical protein